MKKVTINGTEYKLAYNLRSLFIYEEMAGHPYRAEKTIDSYMLLFAMLQANNESFDMTMDVFIDACDEDFGIFQAFSEVMEAYANRMSAFVESKKKAVTQ
jgi:hypothetical protein